MYHFTDSKMALPPESHMGAQKESMSPCWKCRSTWDCAQKSKWGLSFSPRAQAWHSPRIRGAKRWGRNTLKLSKPPSGRHGHGWRMGHPRLLGMSSASYCHLGCKDKREQTHVSQHQWSLLVWNHVPDSGLSLSLCLCRHSSPGSKFKLLM